MKYVVLVAGLGLCLIAGLDLIGTWGYFLGGGLAISAAFFRGKTKIVQTPQSSVPVETERRDQLNQKIVDIKQQIKIRDNESAKKLQEREKNFEKDSQSPPDVIDIRAKLESLRARNKKN